MRLAIIVPHFNPCNYERPQENLKRFIVGLGGCVFCPRDLHVMSLGSRGGFVWQKEPIVNHCVRNLSPNYDAICWIDADLLFSNDNWYADTCRKLEQFPVVQMFETITYLGPDDQPQSLGYGAAAAGKHATFRAPGGAIACRREFLANGIYDRHPLGGGDEIFMEACLGRVERVCQKFNPPFSEHVRRWCDAFGQHPVGFVPGAVKHLWHGDRKGRQYIARHQLLADHDFDPATDVRIGDNGLLEWASNKPALHAAVRDFFINRREDEPCQPTS